MKKIILISLTIILAIGFWSFSTQRTTTTEGEIQWMTFEEAVAQAKKDKENLVRPKKVFIDVYTDWCGWCKVMDKNTFQKAEIAQYINKNFYPVKFNAEQREAIDFKGKNFKYVASGKRGYHELAAALLKGKLSFPTVVFMDEDFRLIQPIAGYLKPDQFAPMMEYFGGDYYKNTPWDKFNQDYQAKAQK